MAVLCVESVTVDRLYGQVILELLPIKDSLLRTLYLGLTK